MTGLFMDARVKPAHDAECVVRTPKNRSFPRADMGIPNVGILSAQVGYSRLAMGIRGFGF